MTAIEVKFSLAISSRPENSAEEVRSLYYACALSLTSICLILNELVDLWVCLLQRFVKARILSEGDETQSRLNRREHRRYARSQKGSV